MVAWLTYQQEPPKIQEHNMSRHSAPRTAPTAAKLAAHVIDLIGDDMVDHTVPATVTTFSQLHDYVDANEYLISALEAAEVEHDAADAEQALLINRTMDMVNSWLAARA
jgi:hypothetical protein